MIEKRNGRNDFNNLKLPPSRRLRIAIGSAVVLLMVGICGFIYAPEHLGELSGYMIAVVIPIVGYLLGESFRPSRDEKRISYYGKYSSPDEDPDENP